MAQSRLELQSALEAFLGSRQVYYQPPESARIYYPAILYELSAHHDTPADNIPYKTLKRYTVTIVDKDPDSLLPDGLKETFSYCHFDRAFKSGNMNHFVFDLYY